MENPKGLPKWQTQPKVRPKTPNSRNLNRTTMRSEKNQKSAATDKPYTQTVKNPKNYQASLQPRRQQQSVNRNQQKIESNRTKWEVANHKPYKCREQRAVNSNCEMQTRTKLCLNMSRTSPERQFPRRVPYTFQWQGVGTLQTLEHWHNVGENRITPKTLPLHMANLNPRLSRVANPRMNSESQILTLTGTGEGGKP